jgi:hypothetical protein
MRIVNGDRRRSAQTRLIRTLRRISSVWLSRSPPSSGSRGQARRASWFPATSDFSAARRGSGTFGRPPPFDEFRNVRRDTSGTCPQRRARQTCAGCHAGAPERPGLQGSVDRPRSPCLVRPRKPALCAQGRPSAIGPASSRSQGARPSSRRRRLSSSSD